MSRVDELVKRLGRVHYGYRVLPFGLHRVVELFQRLMDIVLHPNQAYAAAYTDKVVINHLDQLKKVLMEIQRAGLTANPKKCHLGLSEAQYLGYRIGRGLLKPQEQKAETVRQLNPPTTNTPFPPRQFEY